MPEETPPVVPQGGDAGKNGGNFDINVVVAGMLQKANGDASKVLRKVLGENREYRQEIAALKGKLPADGTVVLSPDEGKRWEAYRKLGDDPKKLGEALEAGDSAGKKWAAHETGLAYEAAAKAEGYNPSLFKLLARDAGLKTSVKEVDNKGKKVARAFVVDAEGKETPVADYAKANWDEHLPLLGGSTEAKRPAGSPPRPDDTPRAPRPGSGSELPDPNQYMNARARYSI